MGSRRDDYLTRRPSERGPPLEPVSLGDVLVKRPEPTRGRKPANPKPMPQQKRK